MLQCGSVEDTHNGALGYLVVKVLELKLLEGRKEGFCILTVCLSISLSVYLNVCMHRALTHLWELPLQMQTKGPVNSTKFNLSGMNGRQAQQERGEFLYCKKCI